VGLRGIFVLRTVGFAELPTVVWQLSQSDFFLSTWGWVFMSCLFYYSCLGTPGWVFCGIVWEKDGVKLLTVL